MSYSPKYQLRFKDLLGGDIVATLSFQDYLGSITDLKGTGDPGNIEFDGDENTIYRPIHQCFAKLNIYEPPIGLIQDLEDIDDTSVMLTITAPNRRFDGFVVADNISRPMDLKGSTLSLDGIDIFSIMKGKILLDENGKIPYGKKTFRWFVERCLSLGTANGFGFGINFVNDYHLNNASGLQLLDEVMFDTSSFKGDDGRPVDCYSIMERFAKSLFSKLHFAEGNLHFITPVSMATDDYMNVSTMTRGMQSGFLIGNLENFGALRGSKEISCKYDFGKNNGLLKNFNFGDWVGGQPTEWVISDNSTVSQVGTGRPESQYGMQVVNKATTTPTNNITNTRITQSIPVNAGVGYSLNIKLKYFDYKAASIMQDFPPYLRMVITLTDTNNTTRELKFDKDLKTDGNGSFIEMTLDSQTGEQVVSVNIKSVPADGLLKVSWQQLVYANYKMTAIRDPRCRTVTYYSAILSVDRSGNADTGVKDYLTQIRDYTQLLSVDDTTIGNAPSEGISGAIYDQFSKIFPYLFKSDDPTPRTALHQLVRAYMATSRKAAKKVEFTVLSNQIRFNDILAINDQGRYIQVKNQYDLRNCKQKITAIELNKDFLPDGNIEATDTLDTYETYPTY